MTARVGKEVIKKKMGKRFLKWRTAFCLEPKVAAKELGITLASYHNLEREITKPSAETLATLSKKFDVNLQWILLAKGEMVVK